MASNLHIDPILESAQAYGRTSYELIKLKAIDKTTGVASTFVSRALAVIAFTLFLLLCSIGLALWLGECLGSPFWGFLVVGGGYGLLGLILYFVFHSRIKSSLQNHLIQQLLKP
jgi:hypothetical protein